MHPPAAWLPREGLGHQAALEPASIMVLCSFRMVAGWCLFQEQVMDRVGLPASLTAEKR